MKNWEKGVQGAVSHQDPSILCCFPSVVPWLARVVLPVVMVLLYCFARISFFDTCYPAAGRHQIVLLRNLPPWLPCGLIVAPAIQLRLYYPFHCRGWFRTLCTSRLHPAVLFSCKSVEGSSFSFCPVFVGAVLYSCNCVSEEAANPAWKW